MGLQKPSLHEFCFFFVVVGCWHFARIYKSTLHRVYACVCAVQSCCMQSLMTFADDDNDEGACGADCDTCYCQMHVCVCVCVDAMVFVV